jgi:hypothetical protein
MKLVQDEVKLSGENFEGFSDEIKSRNDVSEDYLNSKVCLYIK